jgi:hypothetical protein
METLESRLILKALVHGETPPDTLKYEASDIENPGFLIRLISWKAERSKAQGFVIDWFVSSYPSITQSYIIGINGVRMDPMTFLRQNKNRELFAKLYVIEDWMRHESVIQFVQRCIVNKKLDATYLRMLMKVLRLQQKKNIDHALPEKPEALELLYKMLGGTQNIKSRW